MKKNSACMKSWCKYACLATYKKCDFYVVLFFRKVTVNQVFQCFEKHGFYK